MLDDFFELLAFFVVALLRAFFAAGAEEVLLLLFPLFDDVLEVVAAVVVDELADEAVDDFDFDVLLAAFFFGDAAFFFGLLAFVPDFGLAAAFDLGLAVLAFLAPVDVFFLLAVEVVADEVGVVVGELAVDVVLDEAVEVVVEVAAFLADLVGEAERFRFVPLADLGLLDERALEVVLLPLGVFDRLRDFVDVFFLPADEAFFGEDEPTLKLPLAPTPLVCFNELFFVPARNADLRC